MHSSKCILVILCFLFLLDLGLYRYPSRLISHCQGWCPIEKFSHFLQKFFQILHLTVKNFWHLLLFFFIPFYVSSFYCFSPLLLFIFFLSLLLPFLLSLVPQVLSCSFLCFLCLTGSFFDSISVPPGFSFSICFPCNQWLSCSKLWWSLVYPVGYLPYCDNKNELFSAFPADPKCCHPSAWRWFHIFRMSGARMMVNK